MLQGQWKQNGEDASRRLGGAGLMDEYAPECALDGLEFDILRGINEKEFDVAFRPQPVT